MHKIPVFGVWVLFHLVMCVNLNTLLNSIDLVFNREVQQQEEVLCSELVLNEIETEIAMRQESFDNRI